MARDELKKKLTKLKRLLKTGKYDYEAIQDMLDVDYDYARKLVQLLRDKGIEVRFDVHKGRRYFYIPDAPDEINGSHYFRVPADKDGYFKIAIIGDTHLGSKYEALEELHDFYDLLEKERVPLVIHAGDLTDGNGKQYQGHLNEIKVYGFENLLEYVVNNYPKREGIKTVVISGNHDLSFWKQNGVDLVKAVSRERDDILYAGQLYATIEVNGVKIYVVHPDGGICYSRSYRLQKMIEQMEQRPDIVVRGHLHISMYLPYLGVHGFEAGCFQRQTPYLARKGLRPEIGGWIIELKVEDGKIKEIKPRWISYGK